MYLLQSGGAFGSTADTMRESLQATLGEGAIPRLETVVSGYRRTQAEPGVVIGVFVPPAGQATELGLAISEIARDLVTHLPGAALETPFPSWEALTVDGFHPDHDPAGLLASPESLRTVGTRLGIATGVLGELELRESDFQLTLTWHNLKSGSIDATDRLGGPIEELPALPSTVAGWVLERLGHELTSAQREYLEAAGKLTVDQLHAYAGVLTAWRRQGAASAAPLARELARSAQDFPRAAIVHLQLAGSDGEELAMNAFVSELAGLFPDHSGVQLAAVQRWLSERDEGSIRAKQQWLQAIIADDPDYMHAIWLYVEELLVRKRTAEAVSVALEALSRWPDNYRSAWMCAAAIRSLAWQERGSVEAYAESVELGTDAFLPLLAIAGDAVDAALAKHPYSSQLWWLKLETNPGYSEEMRYAFERAIEYDPHNYYVYRSAMTYSSPRWGGSVAAQEEIYELAVTNNPGEEWPDQLYRSVTGEQRGDTSAPGDTRAARQDGERKNLLDHLQRLAQGLGCEEDCVSEIKTLAKLVGFISLALVVLAAARSSNVETLTPPQSSSGSWPAHEPPNGMSNPDVSRWSRRTTDPRGDRTR